MKSALDREFFPNLRQICFFPTWGPKGAKREPKGAKREPKGTKRSQKGGKEHQKSTKSEMKIYEKTKQKQLKKV